MTIFRKVTIAIALLLPVAAVAGPKLALPCCDSGCCPGCPFCPSGLHR